MLEYAKKYEEQLKQLFYNTSFDPFYQYEQFMPYRETLKLPDDTYNANHFVSVYGDDILGMVAYQIKRVENLIWGLHIIHFGGKKSKHNFIFGSDVMTALKDVFEKYGFNKISFCVAIGNPVEKTYDRLIKRYNGRIVGIRKQETRLIDNKLYDVKEYEILAEEYFNSDIYKRGKHE